MAFSLTFRPLIEKIIKSYRPLLGEHKHWFEQPVPDASAVQQLLTDIKAANNGEYHNLDMLWNVHYQLANFYALHEILRCPWQEADPYRPSVQALIDLLDYLGNEIERSKYPNGYSSYAQSCYEFSNGTFRE